MKTKNKQTRSAADTPLADYFGLYNQLLDSRLGRSLQLRKLTERLVYLGARNGMKAANATSRIFKSSGNKNAERLTPRSSKDLFDLNYDEEQLMIRETLKQFAVKMRNAAEKIDADRQIPDDLWSEFHDMQLPFLQTPESMGGMSKERSTVTQMMMAETLAYGDLGQAFAFFTVSSVLNALIRWGTESQQQELVPKFLQEKPEPASMAITEPAPLFSPFELQTTAVKDGEYFVLNGEKNLVPLGESAAFFLVAASTADLGPRIFIVDADSAGLTISEDPGMGLKAAGLSALYFDHVKVHESALLGGTEDFSYADFTDLCKVGWCALAVGTCQAVLDYVIPYANDRVAFGEPISHRQAVAFMIADMKIELESMRVLTQRAAARAEQGLEFRKEAYLAHVLCSDKAMQIGTNGVQLLGGHGYIKDFPVERWYRDLRAVSMAANGLHV